MKRHRQPPEEDHDGDQSELIGLSEINFLLVVALLALVSSAAATSPDPSGAPAPGQAAELVRLDSTPAREAGPSETSASSGAPRPTHSLEGDLHPGAGPVVIAVPEGFPLENIQFLIEKSP